MEHNEKLVLIRNGDIETIAEHINSFVEASNDENGKKCTIELYKDSIGEHILLFPHNIPYHHFTILLNAFDAPWINNTGMQVAGWAKHNEETILLFSPSTDTGLLIGVNNVGKQYAVTGDESSELEDEKIPVDYFSYTFDKSKLERVSVFEFLVDETLPVAEEDAIEDEEAIIQPEAPVKKINTTTIIIAIVIISALLIWLLSMAS